MFAGNSPKVLIINQPFNNSSGGGITQSNLFSGWDKDKLAVVCSGNALANVDTNICSSYYRLGTDEKKSIFPFNLLQRKFKSGALQTVTPQKNNPKSAKYNIRKKIVDDFFYPFIKYIGLYHGISKIKISDTLREWLANFKADILYVQVSERDELLFALNLCSFLKIPMIIHIMDDWPSTISDKGLFKKYWHKKIDAEFKTLLEKASKLLGISDDMAVEYYSRYKKEFIPFHNPIDILFWKRYQRNNYELNENPTILYAGRIGLGIDTSLELIAKSVQAANLELKIQIKFVLQTKEKPVWINKYDCIEHRSFVAYDDLPKVFSEADFLIMPYDFTRESIKYIKYSMPTKLPEYMISGAPIIILAPEETAIVKYAKRLDLAEIVTENDPALLSAKIIYLIQNPERRMEIANNAKRIAEQHHNSVNVRKKFKEVVSISK